MKTQQTRIILLGLLEAAIIVLVSFSQKTSAADRTDHSIIEVYDLKREAFEILDTKCNICHRKKNPFMVFSLKNMEKRAPKIYKQVFLERRMPQGDEIRLTNEEYVALEKWLLTQKLF